MLTNQRAAPIGSQQTEIRRIRLAPIRLPASPRRTAFLEAAHRPSWEKERVGDKDEKVSTYSAMEDGFLLPARNPPKYHLLDLWPMSMVVKQLTKKGKDVKVGKGSGYGKTTLIQRRGGLLRGFALGCAVRL